MPIDDPRAVQIRQRIAAEVRAEIARQGVTHRQLGNALGLDQSSASLRIQGRRPFRAEELVAVAEFLGVAVTQFTSIAESISVETPASVTP
jgi:transcriptional regulator with XRE-family HTH domain